jgi:hypothetical protein
MSGNQKAASPTIFRTRTAWPSSPIRKLRQKRGNGGNPPNDHGPAGRPSASDFMSGHRSSVVVPLRSMRRPFRLGVTDQGRYPRVQRRILVGEAAILHVFLVPVAWLVAWEPSRNT